MKKKKDNDVVICILMTIAFIFMIMSVVIIHINDSSKSNTSSGIKWDGNSITVNRDKNEKYIAIPCFTDLCFESNQTSQKVNIYNPEENECIMDYSIELSDGTTIWQTSNVSPGYGFHDIELTKPLSSGVYEARLITRCFTMDKRSELNGSSFKFKIKVIGD